MRRALHSGLVLALLISFSRAPYEHYHPDEPDHHHSHEAGALAAWHHDEAGEAEWEAPDHDSTAAFKEWLAGDGTAPVKQFAEEASLAWVPALVASERCAPAVRVRNHDPPAGRSLPARAPPSLSYL